MENVVNEILVIGTTDTFLFEFLEGFNGYYKEYENYCYWIGVIPDSSHNSLEGSFIEYLWLLNPSGYQLVLVKTRKSFTSHKPRELRPGHWFCEFAIYLRLFTVPRGLLIEFHRNYKLIETKGRFPDEHYGYSMDEVNEVEEYINSFINRISQLAEVIITSSEGGKHQEPWEIFSDDDGWDQKAVKSWWQGYTCPEIGELLSVSPDRVRNRLSELRKIHGENIVPLDKGRKKYLRSKSRDSM